MAPNQAAAFRELSLRFSDGYKPAKQLFGKTPEPLLLKDYERAFLTEAELNRALRARDWKVDAAYNLLVRNIWWRRKTRPDRIPPSAVKDQSKKGKLYRQGFDRGGRPIIVMRPANENTKNQEAQISNFIYHMEKAVQSMDETQGVETVIVLCDFQGVSISNMVSVSQAQTVISILSDHYFERLHSLYLFNFPAGLSGFLKVVRALAPPTTRAKLKMDKECLQLVDFVDKSGVEKVFGGTLEFVYDNDVYFEREEALHAAYTQRMMVSYKDFE